MITDKLQITQAIKAEAIRLGFSACGIAAAKPVTKNMAESFDSWISDKYHAEMAYMENNREKRYNPELLVEGTKSIICVALNYYPRQKLKEDQLQLAYYAYGKDYHDVMKQKLNALFNYINTELIPVKGRVFCDTAPVMERYWAQQSGIGWIGKNTQLIIPGAGSYFFLGEIFIDTELIYDTPSANRCGSCNKCLLACPTNALESPYRLNASKCISYLTIENRSEIPKEQASRLDNKIYGCDDCQKACPWNRFALPTTTPEFQPSEQFMNMKSSEWHDLTIEKYQSLTKGSAIKRAKYEGIVRNIKTICKHDY